MLRIQLILISLIFNSLSFGQSLNKQLRILEIKIDSLVTESEKLNNLNYNLRNQIKESYNHTFVIDTFLKKSISRYYSSEIDLNNIENEILKLTNEQNVVQKSVQKKNINFTGNEIYEVITPSKTDLNIWNLPEKPNFNKDTILSKKNRLLYLEKTIQLFEDFSIQCQQNNKDCTFLLIKNEKYLNYYQNKIDHYSKLQKYNNQKIIDKEQLYCKVIDSLKKEINLSSIDKIYNTKLAQFESPVGINEYPYFISGIEELNKHFNSFIKSREICGDLCDKYAIQVKYSGIFENLNNENEAIVALKINSSGELINVDVIKEKKDYPETSPILCRLFYSSGLWEAAKLNGEKVDCVFYVKVLIEIKNKN